jgi:hypothetical protein
VCGSDWLANEAILLPIQCYETAEAEADGLTSASLHVGTLAFTQLNLPL